MRQICQVCFLLLVLAALSAHPAVAETRMGADRCLTTLYNYPADDRAADRSRPIIRLQAKVPAESGLSSPLTGRARSKNGRPSR